MRTNKFALSLAVAGLLTAAGVSNAVAEENGAFAGVYLGSRSITVESGGVSASTSGMKYGILGGYHQTLDSELGLRYYGAADVGDDSTNINANVDVLYTFTKSNSFEFRGFAGAWAGYASHTGDFSGFDLGLNVGLRGVIAQKHGVELYGHFGFMSQDKDYTIYGYTYTTKVSQPYQFGIRYTFSF